MSSELEVLDSLRLLADLASICRSFIRLICFRRKSVFSSSSSSLCERATSACVNRSQRPSVFPNTSSALSTGLSATSICRGWVTSVTALEGQCGWGASGGSARLESTGLWKLLNINKSHLCVPHFLTGLFVDHIALCQLFGEILKLTLLAVQIFVCPPDCLSGQVHGSTLVVTRALGIPRGQPGR